MGRQRRQIRSNGCIGLGITGAAYAKVVADYTDIEDAIFFEKAAAAATVNSNPLNNAQTSHDAGTETNYTLEHALEIQQAAIALRSYLLRSANKDLYSITNRMAFAIGDDEVRELHARAEIFMPHYKDLHLADRAELMEIEPKIIEGRPESQRVAALVSDQGFAVNYQGLARQLLDEVSHSKPGFEIRYNTPIRAVHKASDCYEIITDRDVYYVRTLLIASGAYSLPFAHSLGLGLDMTLANIGATFVTCPKVVNGKVYRMPKAGMPFSAIHVDPDILDPSISRFGPTTKMVFVMERDNLMSFFDYIQSGIVSARGVASLASILANEGMLGYVLKNWTYELPGIGLRLFLPEAQAIVPTTQLEHLTLRKGAGGIRPQIIRLSTRKLEMGDATIVGENVIANTTPSPGASSCFKNAERDADTMTHFLKGTHTFDRARYRRDFGLRPLTA